MKSPPTAIVLIDIVRLLGCGFRVFAGLPINTTRASIWPEVETAHLDHDACPDAEGVELDGPD